MTERTCIVTRTTHDPSHLLRFVAGPDGQVVPDLKRALPGRGVWVEANHQRIEEAVQKNAFARGLKMSVKADKSLPDLVDKLIEKAALGALGFARKAGECITGSDKVEKTIRTGRALAVLHASDGAQDGLRKLSQAAFAVHRDGGRKLKIWRVFTTGQMNLALGVPNVIHVSLIEGGAARNCVQRVTQLAQYRGMEPS